MIACNQYIIKNMFAIQSESQLPIFEHIKKASTRLSFTAFSPALTPGSNSHPQVIFDIQGDLEWLQ